MQAAVDREDYAVAAALKEEIAAAQPIAEAKALLHHAVQSKDFVRAHALHSETRKACMVAGAHLSGSSGPEQGARRSCAAQPEVQTTVDKQKVALEAQLERAVQGHDFLLASQLQADLASGHNVAVRGLRSVPSEDRGEAHFVAEEGKQAHEIPHRQLLDASQAKLHTEAQDRQPRRATGLQAAIKEVSEGIGRGEANGGPGSGMLSTVWCREPLHSEVLTARQPSESQSKSERDVPTSIGALESLLQEAVRARDYVRARELQREIEAARQSGAMGAHREADLAYQICAMEAQLRKAVQAEDYTRAIELQAQIDAARQAGENDSVMQEDCASNIGAWESLLQEAVQACDYVRARELKAQIEASQQVGRSDSAMDAGTVRQVGQTGGSAPVGRGGRGFQARG